MANVSKHVQCEGTNRPAALMVGTKIKSNNNRTELEAVKCKYCNQSIRVVVDTASVKRVGRHRRPIG